MRRRRYVVFLCVLVMLLTGCRVREQGSRIVVSRITVTTEYGGKLTRREYFRPESMRQILGMLRLLGQKSTPAIDPEELHCRTFFLTMTHTDGSQHIICTKEDRYIREGKDDWKQVSVDGITQLHVLLQNLPSDDGLSHPRHHIPRYFPIFHLTEAGSVLPAFLLLYDHKSN